MLRAIFAKALMCMVDFITGDFNLFANRQFSKDQGGTMYGGVVIEVLEDVVRGMNAQLAYNKHITFNISASTPPQDVFDSISQDSKNANIDCMLCISIFYNKQNFDAKRPDYITENFSITHDYIHNVVERPRQLSTFDLCLKTVDADWHLPLIVRISAHATRNKRTRGPDSQEIRLQRYRNWVSRDDQQEYQHQGQYYQQHQPSRYYGGYGGYHERQGPYSQSSSSSSRWAGWYGGLR